MARTLPLPAVVIVAALVFPADGLALEAPAGGVAVVNSLGMRMVLVPAGSFRMGSPPGEPLRQEEEVPRRVDLTRRFRIAGTEVTQRQWLGLMPFNRSPQQGGDLPATSVSWPEAREFCRKLSQREGAKYRLPTEAEWEYACRAGGADPPVGREELDAVAWYADNSEGTTHSVGLKKPNAWALHDMLGNAAEWTLDVYGPYPRVEQDENPTRPPGEWTRAFHRGDYPRAIALAGERIRAQPGDVQARIILARAEAAQGRFESAYAEFRKALRIDPRSTDALYYLGITAGVLAQSEYERLFGLAPGSARAHQLQGDSYEAQGQRREAEAEYKAALVANPKSVEVLVALGDLTRRDAAYDEAIAYYARAAEMAPRSYDVLYGLGVCHSFRQEHAKAVEYFRQALRREPDSAPAHLALGSALLQTGQTAAAATELEAAKRLEPRMRQAYFLLGRAYRGLGRSSDAEAAFAKVQELVRQEGEAAEANLEDRSRPPQPPDPR